MAGLSAPTPDDSDHLLQHQKLHLVEALSEDIDQRNVPTEITRIDDLRAEQGTQVTSIMAQRNNPRRQEYDEVQRETAVIYVPDIHGDIDALKGSLLQLGIVDENGEWIAGSEVVVFSGDYIDRGSTNLEVLDYLVQIKRKAENWGGTVEFLVGNHEALAIGALAGDKLLRANWLGQGGEKVLFEVMDKYNLDSSAALIKLRGLMFSPMGPYFELMESMKAFHQVDDVLYVHAGINLEWAQSLASKGVDGVNKEWNQAFAEAKNGDLTKFKKFNEVGKNRLAKGSDSTGHSDVGGPFWADFESELEAMSDSDISKIAELLKSIGVNAIVVGHSRFSEPRISESFYKHGIILVGSDVGMSHAYNSKPGKGGVVVNKNGAIEAESNKGEHILYQPLKFEPGEMVKIRSSESQEIEGGWQILMFQEGGKLALLGKDDKHISVPVRNLKMWNTEAGRDINTDLAA
jgi:hypothetical protein